MFLHLVEDFSLLEQVGGNVGEEHDPLVVKRQRSLHPGSLHYPSLVRIVQELDNHCSGSRS